MTHDQHAGDSAASTADGTSYQGTAHEQVVSDPVRIRALAHPIRLELLDFLDDTGEATATVCSDGIGESVASCSYHLRILAKHGFIEQVDRPGREKPWQTVGQGRSAMIDREAPGSVHAVSAMASLYLHRQFDRIQSWLQRAPQLPVEDADLSTITSTSFYATREEIGQLREDIWALQRRFDGRWRNPEQRPHGSVPVQLLSVLNIDPDRPAHGGPGQSA